MPNLQDEEFTELVDGHFPRVDLVGKAANGVPRFLIAKGAADGGAFEADFVRQLVEGKASMEVVKAGELDASEPLADTPDVYDEPGSEGWEQLDADTAMKWVGILQRAKNAVGLLAGREAEELFNGEGDEGHVFDLEDACCAIQCAIDSLAPFAIGEQAEAELAGEVAKAAWVLQNSTTVGTIEELGTVVKAGRTLSAQNETRIREAVESLQTVLSTLPAPAEVVKEAPEEVAKEDAQTFTSEYTKGANITPDVDSENIPHGDDEDNRDQEVTPTSNTHDLSVPSDVETLSGLADGVAKAAGDPMMAVYTSSGKLLGAVDPSKITMLQDGDGDDATKEDGEAPEAPPTDLSPAPSGTAGMAPAPAGAVAKSTEDVIKAAVEEAVKAAQDAKDAEHASVVKALEDRISALEGPAPSRVLSNGALPPKEMLRGMDRAATSTQVDVAKASELHTRWENAPDQATREAVAKEMNAEAVATWQAMRDARYQPSTSA